jgi:hypothetical protein
MSSDCSRAFEGWLAGCGAATAVLFAVAQTLLIVTSGGDIVRLLGGTVALLFPLFFVFVIICLLTAIPAVIVIWLSQGLRIRSIVFFGGAGATIGALCISLLAWPVGIWTSGIGGLFVVAGLVAGVTYWSVAGRHFICPPLPGK